jgi:hypothetical protein
MDTARPGIAKCSLWAEPALVQLRDLMNPAGNPEPFDKRILNA